MGKKKRRSTVVAGILQERELYDHAGKIGLMSGAVPVRKMKIDRLNKEIRRLERELDSADSWEEERKIKGKMIKLKYEIDRLKKI